MNILNEGYSNYRNLYYKGKGSIVYTRDKKPFIDLSCGAGTLLLGHNSKIRTKSIKDYLNKSLSQFSHPNISAYKLAKTLKKIFPQFEKFVFCNTGAEANIKALRIARAVTGKNLIINVTGSWHGSVDQFLFNTKNNYNFWGINEKTQIKSLSAGIDENLKRNLKYIPSNNIKASEKILKKYKNKICCVLIEPIQGAFPTKETLEYLQFLSNFCLKNKILLFFDEILSGIRVGCSSVQNSYNLKTSISTFGKIIGGGMPIGIIGISKKVNSILKNKKQKIFFGGTYSGNSLSTHVGHKTLSYIIKNKKKIFKKIEKDSEFFEKNINYFINKNRIDAKVIRFHSIIRIIFSKKNVRNRAQRDFFEKNNLEKRTKFLNFLKSKGIIFPGNGIIFFNYSLTQKQLKYLVITVNQGLKFFFK
mgnify:CR=1 FL=1